MSISKTNSRNQSSRTRIQSGASKTQTVKKGDTLSHIAKQNGVSLKALIKANPQIANPNLIKPGQDIHIPNQPSAASSADKTPNTSTAATTSASPHSAAWARAKNLASDALRQIQMPNFQPQNIDQVRNGQARLIRGSRGPAVQNLQEMLNQNGANLAQDGIFGPKTEAALLHYQRTRGITDSGIAGPTTLNNLDNNKPAIYADQAATVDTPNQSQAANGVLPDTSGMSESQQYDYYSRMIEQNNGEMRTGPNERNLLALRQETDTDTRGGRGAYDDRMVQLWVDENGNKRVRTYRANTEPAGRSRGRIGVDADGDGRLDQGRIPAGYYEYRTERHGRLGNVLRPTRSINAERDTNHDGLFNDGAYASAGTSMLMHSGGTTSTGSAGCQTMPPDEYGRFWRDLNSDGNPGRVGYTVVNISG